MTNNEDFKRRDSVEYITVDDAVSYMEIAVPMHVLTDKSYRRFIKAKDMAIEALKSLNESRASSHWRYNGAMFDSWTCGCCGMDNDKETPFCPYCGTFMNIEE